MTKLVPRDLPPPWRYRATNKKYRREVRVLNKLLLSWWKDGLVQKKIKETMLLGEHND